jgi:hypothetical protein
MRIWLFFAVFCGLGFGQEVATISGKVTDALTHQPIPGAYLMFCCGKGTAQATTDAGGVFLMKVLPTGPVTFLQIQKRGYATQRFQRIAVAPGASVTQDFELTPGAEISGRLRDRDSGMPLAGFVAILWGPGKSTIHSTTRPDGSFRFEDLVGGEYTMEIDSPAVGRVAAPEEKASDKGYGRTWFPDVHRPEMAAPILVAAGEKREIEIKLTKRELTHISGEFEVPKGAEKDAIGISLVAPGARFPTVEGQLEKAGKFRIDGLDPGSYTLLASTIPVGEVGHVYTAWTFEMTDHSIEERKLPMQLGVSVRARIRMAEDGAAVPAGVKLDLQPRVLARTAQRGDEDPLFIGDVAPGEYWASAVLPKGYAVASVSYNGVAVVNTTVDVEAPESTVEFVLTAQPGRFSGVVRDGNQTAVAGAWVVLMPESLPDDTGRFDDHALHIVEADPSGGFFMGKLAPGKYRAIALAAADKDRNADLSFLQSRLASAEVIEISKGQTVSRDLTVR